MSDTFPKDENPRLSARIREFFYREEIPFSLAVVRIILPLVLIRVMWPRWFHARELYSSDGAPCPMGLVYGWVDFLPTFSGEVVVAMHSILLLALVASSIGWCTRLSLGLSTVLYIYLNMMDSVSTITKYSVIASHVLLLLTLSQCGAVWSVDSWLKGFRRRKDPWPGEPAVRWQKSPVWPKRLMQLMIGLVYLGAAITKMHTPEFFSGDQMTYWMLTNVNHANPGGELLSQYPSLIVASGYCVIVWEITFVFLAWKGWGRKAMIAFGVLFHVMTAVTLGLFIFPIVCCVIYFSFLNEEDFRSFGVQLRRLRRRWKLPRFGVSETLAQAGPLSRNVHVSWGVYAGALLLAALVGLGAEYQLDPYGIRRPQGSYTLKEVSPEIAAEWIRETEPIREVDKVFAFDIGTISIADSLANRKKVFQHGERLIAQVSLNPPHEDMYVECNLHDAEDRLVERSGSVIARERFRGHFYYSLTPSLPPGEYQLVLSHAGKELTRRWFQLTPGETAPNPQAASAN